jgi:dihydroxyacetone kinase-like protein
MARAIDPGEPDVMNSLRAPTTRLQPKVKMTCRVVGDWMRLFEANIGRAVPLLTDLDRAIGDGDHGVNIYRGIQSVVTKLAELKSPDLFSQLRTISVALTSSVGGASGPLYGAFCLQGAQAVLYKSEIALPDLILLADAGCQGVVKLGKAAVGDKTMVDTLHAVVVSLRESGHRRDSLPDAVSAGARAARAAAEGTTPMVARKGRASYLGDRSAGFQDPGATSAQLLFESLAEAVALSAIPSSTTPNPSVSP